MAWTCLTLVTQDGRKKRSSVLAAAGRRGVVSLIHVHAGFCYGDIRVHRKPIAMACFSPSQETHLFSKTSCPTGLSTTSCEAPGRAGGICQPALIKFPLYAGLRILRPKISVPAAKVFASCQA